MKKQALKEAGRKPGRGRAKSPERSMRAYDYLMSVFQSSPVALISLDSRLRIMLFNRAAQELTGFQGHEIFGSRVSRIIERDRLHRILETFKDSSKVSTDGYITKLRSKSGMKVPVRIKISPLFGSNRNLMGVLVIATDLREIKRFQTKLLEAERLAAITETAIGINHEINNPLCAILGNTQLLLMEKDKLDPRVIKRLKSIEKEITRIHDVAERLARISRPVLKEYVGGKLMLDVERSEVETPPSKPRSSKS
jgi:two-component system NtrC family sensor kinase